MRKTVTLMIFGLMIVATGAVLAQGDVKDAATIARMNNRGPGFAAPSPRGSVSPVPRSLGPIQTVGYDTGTVTGQSVSSGNRVFGNRFDTALGNPVGPGTSVTQVTVFVAGLGGTAIFATAFDQLNTGAATANSINDFLWSTGETAINVNALNTWIVANAGEGPMNFVGSSILFGLWNTAQATGTTEDAVGLDSSGTTMGQGFHGMQINFGGGSYSTMQGVNAIVRVTGSSLPVELTSFQLDNK